MKSHNRLVQVLTTLGDKHRGSFLRYVPLRYGATPIDAIGSVLNGGRYNPINDFEVLYLAKTPDTAAREVGLVVLDPVTGKEIVVAKEPQILLTIGATLQFVVDLRDTKVRTALGVTKRALLCNWEDEVHHGRVPPTHELGRAARDAGVEALISPSAKHAGWNLNVIYENLIVGSNVEIHAASPGFAPGIITRYEGRRPDPRTP